MDKKDIAGMNARIEELTGEMEEYYARIGERYYVLRRESPDAGFADMINEINVRVAEINRLQRAIEEEKDAEDVAETVRINAPRREEVINPSPVDFPAPAPAPKPAPKPAPAPKPLPLPEPEPAPAPKPAQGSRFCVKCGSRLSEEDIFCVKCGFRQPDDVLAVKPAPAPKPVTQPKPAPAPIPEHLDIGPGPDAGDVRTCPACHAAVEEGSVFCIYCGQKLQ